ncbi:hypothetical protein [Palleronia sp. LCG004]|uniref:hypothetical protein n=1 Tax=Palleronia sp. LCG004 TaxID=3079304 RepID=UPI00294246CF|nr:hypothetical protein [Palleronia sp. LCG004]WOI56969.1 hypothetical protein RVY76_04005 [Palleronia sp. LCG004]
MGRPLISLTSEQAREVETLAVLLSQDQIADYFGISRSTFHAICSREPEVLKRYKRGKAKAIAHVANGLLQKARAGCMTSSIFYLKTPAGWRETAEIHHRPAGPSFEELSDAELFARFAELMEEVEGLLVEASIVQHDPDGWEEDP